MARGGITGGTRTTIKVPVRTKVFVRKFWHQPWKVAPYLEPIQATRRVAPDVGEATFIFRYGNMLRRGKSKLKIEEPARLTDHFVLIVKVDKIGNRIGNRKQPELWIGIIGGEDFEQFGKGRAQQVPGEIQLRAYTLEHVLDRMVINSSFAILTDDMDVEEDVDELQAIDWMPTFNRKVPRSSTIQGNMSATLFDIKGSQRQRTRFGGPPGFINFSSTPSHVFSRTGKTWNMHEVIRYLLCFFQPSNLAPNGLEFTLASLGKILKFTEKVEKVWDFGGRSVLQALHELIDPRLGFGFYINPFTNSRRVEVVLYTTSANGLATESSDGSLTTILPRNPVRVKFDASTDPSGTEIIEIGTEPKYDAVEVIGGRVVTCFSVAFLDNTLQAGWTAAELTAYKAGAGEQDGVANDLARRIEERKHIFGHLVMKPEPWRFKIGTTIGSGGFANPPPHPLYGHLQGIGSTGTIQDMDQTVLNWIPLSVDEKSPRAAKEFRKPFVLMIDPKIDKWNYVEKILEKTAGVTVRPLVSRPGMEVRTSTPHLLALGSFNPADDGTGASKIPPIIDYRTAIATVAMLTDQVLAIRRTLNFGGELNKIKRIHLPDAQLWYIHPGTVIGADFNNTVFGISSRKNLIYHKGDPAVRNDRGKLVTIAALASVWYSVERKAVTIKVAELGPIAQLGAMVISIANFKRNPINTPVTSIEYDFVEGTTTVSTAYPEIDFTRIGNLI